MISQRTHRIRRNDPLPGWTLWRSTSPTGRRTYVCVPDDADRTVEPVRFQHRSIKLARKEAMNNVSDT